MEERVLSAIHTEPENYVAGSEQSNRQGRLVGFPELFPVQLKIILKRGA